MSAPAPPASSLRRLLARPLTWDLFLAALTVVWAIGFIKLFTPGRLNVDIGNQYQQAIGRIPLSDWHPPVMSVVWRVLIDVTGDPGSLLVLQVGLLALAAWIIGVLVHRSGAPRWVSLLGPATMALPWVVAQMTTLWKDTQMGVALLLAVVLIATVRFAPKAWPLWVPALLLLIYAVGLRKNALFALVPIAVFGGYCLAGQWRAKGRTGRSRTKGRSGIAVIAAVALALLVLVGGGAKAVDMAIGSREEVKATGQISQIFLDDVMFSVPEARLQAADEPQELKDHISSARDTCLKRGEIWDAYWNCYGRGTTGRAFSPVAYQDELRSLWLHEVITHPVSYVEYRSAVFSYYFFTSQLEYWHGDWDGEAQKIGYPSGSAKADFIVRPYVEDFALATFPMLFKPWFWTLLSVILLSTGLRHRRKTAGTPATVTTPATKPPSRKGSAFTLTAGPPRRGRTFWPEITALAASALVYVLGYFPIVPANHFRYTFWPALAVTVALILWLAQSRAWERPEPATANDDAAPSRGASSESET